MLNSGGLEWHWGSKMRCVLSWSRNSGDDSGLCISDSFYLRPWVRSCSWGIREISLQNSSLTSPEGCSQYPLQPLQEHLNNTPWSRHANFVTTSLSYSPQHSSNIWHNWLPTRSNLTTFYYICCLIYKAKGGRADHYNCSVFCYKSE